LNGARDTTKNEEGAEHPQLFLKTKHITSTFNDSSTGSCICLRLDLYMLHVMHIISTRTGCILLPCNMYKSSLTHIHDPVLLSLKVEVICFVLSCFPPSLPPFRIPRPHTCIGSEPRLSLREGSTAQAAMTSLCYDSCEFHWNKRRLRNIHVKRNPDIHSLFSLKGPSKQTHSRFPNRAPMDRAAR